MVDNLGIYNSQVESDYDINKHIEQGVHFKQFKKDSYSETEYKFLQESTAPEWGSIVDTSNDENSTKKKEIIEGMTMSQTQVNFNNMVSQYASDYNTYISTYLNKPQNKYNDLGCWKDTADRALTGPPQVYGHTVDSCYDFAKKNGSSTFALQDSGWCVTSNPNDKYDKYGRSESDTCPPLGGGWTNHVYNVDTSYDRSRKAAEAALLIQKNNILAVAKQINSEVQLNNATRAELMNVFNGTQQDMRFNLNELNVHKKKIEEMRENYDLESINGAMETTELNMNSMYYHVFVYMLIALTLFAYIFNLLVNPNANVLNAIFVLGSLSMVYIISKYFVN
jgi:hypothetical protein